MVEIRAPLGPHNRPVRAGSERTKCAMGNRTSLFMGPTGTSVDAPMGCFQQPLAARVRMTKSDVPIFSGMFGTRSLNGRFSQSTLRILFVFLSTRMFASCILSALGFPIVRCTDGFSVSYGGFEA